MSFDFDGKRLGMILKGYPRISESFISYEILLLESYGIPVEIFSLRKPRESFSHEHVKRIEARVTYLPEYVLPNLGALLAGNLRLWRKLGPHYAECLADALARAVDRRKTATVRHFLQAGLLAETRLLGSPVRHIHAHFCHTPASVALFASELTGLPFSFTAHAKDIYTSEPEQLTRKIKKARFIVTCTGYNAAYLARLAAGARRSPAIHTVYHGIDLELFKFEGAPRPFPPYRILSVGRTVPKKGYDDLLKALKLLEDRGLDFQFTHVGSADMKPDIRAMARDLGISHRVKTLGVLPHEEVLKQYRNAHCFALACKVAEDGDRDGIPNVLVEAMAVGLPVVSTRVSAIPELVRDGVTGALTDPGDPPGLAEAIRRTLLDGERIEDTALRARAAVEESFDSRRCVARLRDLFGKALQDS